MNRFRIRLQFICLLFAFAGLAVAGRLFVVQVVQGPELAEQSRMQSQERCIVPARRGDIRDRCGRVLSANTQGDLSLTVDLLGAAAQGASPVKRAYPLGAAAGPLTGCIGKDGYGLSGVEFTYDKYLRGEDGWIIVQRDGRNHRYRKIGLPSKEPRMGGTVYLTIDAEIQKIADDAVKESVASLHAHGGRCIVMDPATGRILAMVNEPSFDPNAPGDCSKLRLQNDCLSAIFEPGSTFKIVTASAALQEGVKKEDDIIDANNGVLIVCKEPIRDHEPYGKLTFAQALAYSSNICFAKIGMALGSQRLYRYATDFGFGARSGINLSGEERGILHPVSTWSGRTLATMAFGQEVSVTLMQMMAAYGAIANNGVLVKPQIVEKIVGDDGAVVEQTSVQPVRRVVSDETARRLCVLFKGVVDSGTGKKAAIGDIAVAGKTGTAQKLDGKCYSKTRSWASFIGFMPSDHPVLLCGVVIDEPANNLMGGTAAAPVFKKIMTQILGRPDLDYAERLLKYQKTQTAAAGNGTAVAAGRSVPDKKNVADDSATVPGEGNLVPAVCGRDVRDAINLVKLQGIEPIVIGAGIVCRQSPAAGMRFSLPRACTLICTYDYNQGAVR
jgi:cell division protein FtsI/penicillin-binding protein 2